MKLSSSRRGVRVCLAGATVVAAFLPLGETPVFAAGISDPPVAPHEIISFPVRDFVSATGYAAGDRPTVQVLRGGTVVGTARGVVPQDDPKTTGFDGLVEVNHPGGGCWEGVTPDIRAGDVIRVLTSPDTGDQTTTAGVSVTSPATKQGSTTVVVKGTAVSGTGTRIPIDQIEARIVANQQAFMVNGRRTLRADTTGTADGMLAYDGPTATTWTATFTGLGQVNPADGLSDADRAVANQTRILWLGRDPAAGVEGTIFEYGEVPGPAAPCTAPLATGPSVPDLTAGSDTGVSSTDNVTAQTKPVFTGAVGLPDAQSVNLYVDGVLKGSTPVVAGTYTVSPTAALADGPHDITAGEVSPTGIETRSSGVLAVTIDTQAPASPTVTGTSPGSPAASTTPTVRGTAEAGATVDIFGGSCTSPAVATGSAQAFASTGIAASVPSATTTRFVAAATDAAGNVSGCSATAVTYIQDSVPPPAPTIATSSTSGLVKTATADFAFTDAEAAATFSCSLDDAAFVGCASPVSYAGIDDGSHTFAVRAADAAGNVGDAATRTWTVDTVAPTVSISSPVGTEINDPAPTFRFSPSEAGSRVECSLDGATPAPCTSSTTHAASGLADGAHTFTVRATDAAGNTGPDTRYSFTVDTRVPVVSIDSAPPSPTNHSTPAFGFSSDEPGASLRCAFALASVTNPSFVACPDGTYTVASPRADGDYRFTVRAIDASGNVGTASARVVIDTTAPTAPTLTRKPAALSNLTTPSFDFVSQDPGATFVCGLSPGVATEPCVSGAQYGPLADGNYTFKVQARDAAGNVGPTAQTTFTIETQAPRLTSRTPAPGATAVSQSRNVTATFTEDVIAVDTTSFRLTGPTGQAIAATVLYDAATSTATLDPATTLAPDTLYTATLKGVLDRAGNPLTTTTWTFLTGPRPVLRSKTPAAGAIGIGRSTNVTATFSEQVTKVSGATFVLKRASTGLKVTAVVSYDPVTRTAKLDPSVVLAGSAKYTATLTSAITDTAGNGMKAVTWSFTTRA